ncbi:aminoacyl tRNA synthase complex-interacting multifunctional protein 1 [Gadus morhua]|uniref:aminoacyl tRNA synthase complex-interacting multifunctional protein 1 n=1 Tax=Gadus morhua TaxID=8049 RepID=UPI0011B4A116|nr:aminoacyl tRNA synthase complex-interacting multifunctional protein 1-like [Gadus morhua]
MADSGDIFKPSFAAMLHKLDPDDSEQILDYFKTNVLLIREKALLQASVREEKKLLVENARLKNDIADLRVQLQEKNKRKIAKALFAPVPPTAKPALSLPVRQSDSASPASALEERAERPWRRRRGERRARPKSDTLSLGEEPRVDVSRLDIRIGRVLSIRRHPLAETLSVQVVELGEPAPRTVVSKLNQKQDVEELCGNLVVVLCNVRPCKLKGVVSQARLLCCSTSDDNIEMLAPPPGSIPGDRVTFNNYPGEPDRELVSKDRVWEILQPDLQTDGRGVASYKGAWFEVKGKGLCRIPTLTNCSIH